MTKDRPRANAKKETDHIAPIERSRIVNGVVAARLEYVPESKSGTVLNYNLDEECEIMKTAKVESKKTLKAGKTRRVVGVKVRSGVKAGRGGKFG